MGWDVTQGLGEGYDLGAEESIIMECDGWELTKVWWVPCDNDDDEPMIWANHVDCKYDRPQNGQAQHFPRDNALVGWCTYCEAPCPDHFQVLFKMYNWKWLAGWGQPRPTSSNTFIGYNAGSAQTTGSQNIYIGGSGGTFKK